jgi:hypothetical protein
VGVPFAFETSSIARTASVRLASLASNAQPVPGSKLTVAPAAR